MAFRETLTRIEIECPVYDDPTDSHYSREIIQLSLTESVSVALGTVDLPCLRTLRFSLVLGGGVGFLCHPLSLSIYFCYRTEPSKQFQNHILEINRQRINHFALQNVSPDGGLFSVDGVASITTLLKQVSDNMRYITKLELILPIKPATISGLDSIVLLPLVPLPLACLSIGYMRVLNLQNLIRCCASTLQHISLMSVGIYKGSATQPEFWLGVFNAMKDLHLLTSLRLHELTYTDYSPAPRSTLMERSDHEMIYSPYFMCTEFVEDIQATESLLTHLYQYGVHVDIGFDVAWQHGDPLVYCRHGTLRDRARTEGIMIYGDVFNITDSSSVVIAQIEQKYKKRIRREVSVVKEGCPYNHTSF